MTSIVKLMPHAYMHVENTNTCDVLTLLGPITFTLYDHHNRLHGAPQPCVVVPPGHYVIVTNPLHPVSASHPTAASTTASPGISNAGPNPAAPAQSHSATDDNSPVYPLLYSDTANVSGVTTRLYSRRSFPLGSREIRFADASPFPLLPDEEVSAARPVPLLSASTAFVLEAVEAHDVTDPHTGQVRHRAAQEQFLHRGPGLYRPRLDENIVREVEGTYVTSMQVCDLTAQADFTDDDGVARIAGEQWTLRPPPGIYFAHPLISLHVRRVCVVGDTEAVEFESTEAFTDDRLRVRREANTPYLVTFADTVDGVYVPRTIEREVARRRQIHLSASQYCVVTSPVSADGTAKVREAEIRVGRRSFIAQPGECVTRVLNALVLKDDEALLLTALQSFTEADAESNDAVVREGGSRWLVRGPREYIPPIYAKVLERRCVISLNENSGVYVRNIYSGQIRSVFGTPFMLSADEELWARPISAFVRRLLAQPRQSLRVDDMSAEEVAEAAVEEGRAVIRLTGEAVAADAAWCENPNVDEDNDFYTASTCTSHHDSCGADVSHDDGATSDDAYRAALDLLQLAEHNAHPRRLSRDIERYRVISANVEHNTLMRLYDTSTGRSRVVAGPATVYLEPHEHFTPLSLSGGRPKEPHRIHSLSLYLGPDYMADIIEVETRDHARLRLHLAYNWEFEGVEFGSPTGVNAELAFTIPDFIGEACKALASRVRSVIAGQTFEYFHCNSSSLIRQAIFAATADGSTVLKKDSLYFTANGLRIYTVDVQSVEPVDAKTRTALTKSVQLAVEIITTAQESDASHQAALLEQEARGALDLQMMQDRAKAETQRTALLKVMGDNTVLEQAGASRAQALAESGARLAEAEGEVEATPVRCTAHAVGMDAELEVLRRRAELDLAYRASMNALSLKKAKRLAVIEAAKHESVMHALGKATLVAIANAGPELKAQLLGALGLQGFVVTDGTTPINMLDFANQIASKSSPAGV